MLNIRIQILIWFSCAVLLRQNHGFTPTPRFQARRATLLTSWTFYPPRTSLYTRENCNDISVVDYVGNESCHDGERRQKSRRQQESSSSHLALTASGVVAAAMLLRSTSRTEDSSQSRTKQATTPIVSALLATTAVALMLQAFAGCSPMDVCASMARQAMSWYFAQLNAYPLVTKSVTSGFIGAIGDYAAQWLEYRLGRRRPADNMNLFSIYGTYHCRRGLAILVDGIFISGPIMHWGYDWFERIVPTSSSSMAAMVHVLADTLLLDSIFIATTIVLTGLVEGFSLRQDIIPQLKRDYVNTLKAGWVTSVTLVPLGFVCFRFFPLTLRTVVMNLMDILWDGIISFMAHKSRQKEKHTSTPTTMLVQEVKCYLELQY